MEGDKGVGKTDTPNRSRGKDREEANTIHRHSAPAQGSLMTPKKCLPESRASTITPRNADKENVTSNQEVRKNKRKRGTTEKTCRHHKAGEVAEKAQSKRSRQTTPKESEKRNKKEKTTTMQTESANTKAVVRLRSSPKTKMDKRKNKARKRWNGPKWVSLTESESEDDASSSEKEQSFVFTPLFSPYLRPTASTSLLTPDETIVITTRGDGTRVKVVPRRCVCVCVCVGLSLSCWQRRPLPL